MESLCEFQTKFSEKSWLYKMSGGSEKSKKKRARLLSPVVGRKCRDQRDWLLLLKHKFQPPADFKYKQSFKIFFKIGL